ncbi:Zinc finger, ring/fyve/phd-type, partial [Globisporangium polare]
MYTLSDEARNGGGSARNREPSPFLGGGNNEARGGSARHQGNDTFTAAWATPNSDSNNLRSADVRAPSGRTTTMTGSSRTGTMTGSSRTGTMMTAMTGTTGTSGSRTTTSNSRKKKNVDDENPFRLPELSSAEMAYMVRKAKESSIALVDHAHTLDGPVEWQYTGKFRGIQMYRGEGTSNEEAFGMEYLCGVTTMAGTLEEVSTYFDQSTTERMRAKKADDVLDCAVLYAIERGDAKNPFYRVSVKYTSFEGPSTFSRARDYVYLECQNTFRHASGRRGWVLSMHSIKLPNCPEMDGTVRGSMYHSGYVFVEAEKPGYMDVMHSLQINFKATKRLPSFMLNSALKRRITSVIKISREIQMARMGQQALLKKEDLMPKNSRSLCANCSRKFTLFIRKTRCRMCGQVVCQSCAPQVDWDIPGEGTKKTRICVKCYRTGGNLLAPSSTSTGTSKNSADFSDDEDMIEEATAAEEAAEHSHDDDDEEAAADDGLEEQTEVSVFAQSRFTRATADSMFSFTSEFHIHDLGASSSANNAMAPGATGGFAWKDNLGTSYDQPGSVMEHSAFNADMSVSSNFYDTKLYLTPEDTDEELDKRARRYDPNFRETSIVETRGAMGPNRPPPPPPYDSPPQLTSQLSADALKEHNMRFQSAKKHPPPPPVPAPLTPQQASGKIVSIKDIRSNFMKGTTKGDLPAEPKAQSSARFSHADDDYISHPPSAILNQVRANRSRTIQFAPEGDYRSPEMMQSIEDEHNKRMAELNKAASGYSTGYRPTEPETNDDNDGDEPFTLEHLQAAPVAAKEESSFKNAPIFSSIDNYNDYRQSTGESARESVVSPRMSDQLDADEYYAPSALELSQVRANRSHTIEFIPQFMQPEEGAEEDEEEELSSSEEDEQEQQAQVVEEVQQQQQQTQRRSADVKQQRVTEQYANLQIPTAEVVEMSPTAAQGKGEDDDDDEEARSRFSQTMIPILDYSTDGRNSEVQSVSGLSIEIETRASRQPSDIPILDYGLDQSMSSVRESDFDYELINRSTAVIMEQVHANRIRPVVLYENDDDNFRSTEIMKDIEEEHRKRMAELNRIAMDYTGNRISRLNLVDESRESMDTIDYERMSGSYLNASQQHLGSLSEDLGAMRASEAPFEASANSHSSRQSRDMAHSSRSATDFNSNSYAARISSPKGYVGSRMTSLEFMPEEELEFKQPNPTVPTTTTTKSRFTNLEFSLDLLEPRDTIDAKIGSPRESMEFDDELINRSTAVIMDQVRANRERVPTDLDMSEGDIRSTAIMKDIELEHKKRMAELNQIALENVGGRISTFPTGTPRDSEDSMFGGDHSMLRQVNTSHVDPEWRSTTIMDRYHNAHDAKMEALQEKVRELDEQCRASMASIFSADELDFTELDTELATKEAVRAQPQPPAPALRPKYKHRGVPPRASSTASTASAASNSNSN